MTGKICMVTGANDGIGKATALGLAKMSASVVMVCRSRERGEATLADVREKTGNSNISLVVADLSFQAAIRKLVRDFEARYPALHVLINNAGIIPRERTVTVDGLEMQFAVNHLAPFLLTNLLLDLLKASAPARIVNVASEVHHDGSIHFEDLQSERSYRPYYAYAQSKLANVLFTYELARRLQGTGVTPNCLHPGVVATKLLADGMGIPRTELRMGISPQEGARTSLYLATSPEVEGVSGKYFVNRRPAQSSKESHDRAVAKRLWQVSADLVGVS